MRMVSKQIPKIDKNGRHDFAGLRFAKPDAPGSFGFNEIEQAAVICISLF